MMSNDHDSAKSESALYFKAQHLLVEGDQAGTKLTKIGQTKYSHARRKLMV